MRRPLRSAIIALTCAVGGAAWGRDQEPGVGELPPPPPDLPLFAAQPVARPFEQVQGQPGASRILFEGPGPDNTQVTIRELLIGPKGHLRLEALRGPALIDARSGTGRLQLGDQSALLQITTARSVAPGVPIEVSNDGDDTLVLRLYVVEAH